MAPSPIPAPLPPWARALLQLLPFIAAGLQEVLDHIGQLNDNTAAANSEWRHCQVVWSPFGSVEVADQMVTTFDIANITNGQVDNSWTDSDYTKVHTCITQMVYDWMVMATDHISAKEVRYYRRSFNPIGNPKPFTVAGPPEKIIPLTNLASVTSYQAPQVAMTTTERTTYAKHWGRNYWPCLAPTTITKQGRIVSTSVDYLAAAIGAQYDALMAQEFFPVVPVTQVAKVPTRGLLTVTNIQVDDLPDIVRRRRPKFRSHVAVHPPLT